MVCRVCGAGRAKEVIVRVFTSESEEWTFENVLCPRCKREFMEGLKQFVELGCEVRIANPEEN